jgi:hypothetical protein
MTSFPFNVSTGFIDKCQHIRFSQTESVDKGLQMLAIFVS